MTTDRTESLWDRYRGHRPARVAAAIVACAGVWVFVFGFPILEKILPYRIDLDVYRRGAGVLAEGGDLYGKLPGIDLPFTYPPFAALVFRPLSWVPYDVGNLLFAIVSVAALMWVVTLLVREVTLQTSPEAIHLAVPLFALAVWTFPVMQTAGYGQINLFLLALIITDLCLGRGKPWQGVLIGIALSIKLTPAVFLGYFLVRKQWRALAMSIVSGLVCTAVAWWAAPHDSASFWSAAVQDPSRVGQLSFTANQSLNGLAHRLPLPAETVTMMWVIGCALLAVAVLVLAHRLVSEQADLTAMVVLAFLGLVCSPVSWTHHWVWSIPALMLVVNWWHRAEGRMRVAWATLGWAGAAIFFVDPTRFIPQPQTEGIWWWQFAYSEAMTGWALTFFIMVWLRTGAREFTRDESTQQWQLINA